MSRGGNEYTEPILRVSHMVKRGKEKYTDLLAHRTATVVIARKSQKQRMAPQVKWVWQIGERLSCSTPAIVMNCLTNKLTSG